MAQLPAPLRATLGLAATVVDAVKDGRGLPPGWTDKVLELPVLAVSTALQVSLRAQQQYNALTVRGDELLSQLRGPSDEPPEWATFDDDPIAPATAPSVDEPPTDEPPTATAPAKKPPAKKPAVTKSPVTKAAAKNQAAKKPSAFDLIGGDQS